MALLTCNRVAFKVDLEVLADKVGRAAPLLVARARATAKVEARAVASPTLKPTALKKSQSTTVRVRTVGQQPVLSVLVLL